MGMRHDHEVAVIVGIAIQHHKGRVSTPENQVLGILLCLQFLTKDAARRLVTQNIGHTPRCPDDIGHALAPLLTCTLCPAAVAPTHCTRSTGYQVHRKNALLSQPERTATYGPPTVPLDK